MNYEKCIVLTAVQTKQIHLQHIIFKRNKAYFKLIIEKHHTAAKHSSAI